MFPAHSPVLAATTNPFNRRDEMSYAASGAYMQFDPNFSREMKNFCQSVNAEAQLFNFFYPTVTIALSRHCEAHPFAGVTQPDYFNKQQSIIIHVREEFDVQCPIQSARASYTLMHELFAHAAPNSWYFSDAPDYTVPSETKQNDLTHQHHLNMFLPARHSNPYHQFILKAAQRFKFEPAKAAFLTTYVEDIRLGMSKLDELGLLKGRDKNDAEDWLMMMQQKTEWPNDAFWRP
ncbi:MAG: hypothetical protein ACRYGK_01870 [Janthinobacterium lividum]